MAKRTRSERDAAKEFEGEDDVPEIVRLRRKNMARNAAMLAALNVGQSKPIAPVKQERPNAKTSPCKSGEADAQSPSLRRSRRLKGDVPVKGDDTPLYALPGTWVTALTYGSRGRKDVMAGGEPVQELYATELSEAEAKERKKVLQEHIDAREDGTAGTASYDHCLHRVRTMSDQALARRIRSIERARGKHAAEKMLVTTQVLRAKGKDELCALAEAALDRIVRGVPMPNSNETPAPGVATCAAAQGATAEGSASSPADDEKQR